MSSHRRLSVLSGLVVGAVLVAAACSGIHQSLAPVPPQAQPSTRSASNDIGSDEDAGPLTSVTANVVVTVPASAPTTKSISISVNGGAAVIANLTSGSPGCSGTPLVCTISVTVPTGTDLFAFQTFSGTGGTGSVVASGKVFQKITTTSFTVDITLAGSPAAITLALKTTAPHECDPARNIALYIMVMDSSRNTIIGSYGESVSLTDSDTSGKTTLSATSLSSSATAITTHYNGFPLKSATFSASATGVPSSAVTKAVLKPLQMIYVPGYDSSIGNYAVLVFPSNATGNVAPTRTISGGGMGFNGGSIIGVALDGSCHLFVLEFYYGEGDNIADSEVDVFNAGANGSVSPIRYFYDTTTPLRANPNSIAVDSSGNPWIGQSSPTVILEYSALASGDVTPIADITGGNTDLSNPITTIGPTSKIYSVQAQCCTNNVLVFAAGSNGNVAPSQVINANSNAQFVGVDSSGKIYVGDQANNDVQVYAGNATGNATPVATVSGSQTLLNSPTSMAFGYSNNFFIANSAGGTVSIGILQFLSGANGNAPPHANITGSMTNIGAPIGGVVL